MEQTKHAFELYETPEFTILRTASITRLGGTECPDAERFCPKQEALRAFRREFPGDMRIWGKNILLSLVTVPRNIYFH